MAVGNCNCYRIVTFDPEVHHDLDEPPTQHERRQLDPVEQLRTITHPNFQSNPQMLKSDGQNAEFSNYVMPPKMVSPGGTAESSHGFAIQHGMQSQRHVFDPSSSDPARTAARSTRLLEGTQLPHQEQSQSVALSQSLLPAQGDSAPQQGPPNSNTYSEPRIRPVQSNDAHLQPQFSPYGAYQPMLNGNNAQEHHHLTISDLSRSPDPSQYSMDPAHPTTLYQRRYFEARGHIYPERRDPYPMYDPHEVQPEEFNHLTNINNCGCGPGCNCVYCRQHPYNSATLERVRYLSHIVELDNYDMDSGIWGVPTNGTLTSGAPTNSTNGTLANGTNGTLTNGTNGTLANGKNGILANGTNGEPIIGQAYQQPEGPPTFMNLRDQGPTFQSTLNEGQVLNEGNQSNEFQSRTMRTSDYYTIEYPADLSCSNSPGTWPCPAPSSARTLTH